MRWFNWLGVAMMAPLAVFFFTLLGWSFAAALPDNPARACARLGFALVVLAVAGAILLVHRGPAH